VAEQKNDRKVFFRRIRGRIVPISVGAGLVGAATLAKKHEKSIWKKGQDMARTELFRQYKVPPHYMDGSNNFMRNQLLRIKSYKRLHADDLKKANVGFVKHKPFGAGSMFSAITHKSGDIILKNADYPTFLHELGHAQQQASKSKKLFYKTEGKLNLFTLRNAFSNSKVRRNLAVVSDKLGDFVKGSHEQFMEWDAWRRAFGMARSPKQKLRVIKRSFPALGSYAAKPIARTLKYGLAAAGIGMIGYGIMKKEAVTHDRRK
jgi:hypothetical protein